ncbi:MAG: hypothetical protein ACRDPM_20910 [Solirubrobacteraceae bacterium]
MVFVVGVAIVAAGSLCSSAGARSFARLPVLNVVPRLARGTVAKTVGPSGVTLTVRQKAGAVTLKIPPGAMAAGTAVSLSPLSAVKRVPFKHGVVGAVQIGPEGLVLQRPATLTFRPRARVPVAMQAPFSASGSGASFHLYPGRRGRTFLTVPLFHFSIYGEGEASPQEQVREEQRAQSSPQAAEERDLAGAASDTEIAKALLPAAVHVERMLREAEGDDAKALDAVDQALTFAEELRWKGWSSEVLPPGLGDSLPRDIDHTVRPGMLAVLKAISDLFPGKVLDNALRAATDRCASQHQPALAQRILDIQEARRLLGLTSEVDTGPVARCLTFELDIDTDFKSVGQRLPSEVHAQARIALHPTPTLDNWSGTAPITYLAISEPYGDGGCTVQASGTGTWTVLGMRIFPGKVDRTGAVRAPAAPQTVTLLPPLAQESYTVSCPAAGSFSNKSLMLTQGWEAAHADEVVQGAFYELQSWSAATGDEFGAKTYSRTFQVAGETWSETTTIQLRHTPGPG